MRNGETAFSAVAKVEQVTTDLVVLERKTSLDSGQKENLNLREIEP